MWNNFINLRIDDLSSESRFFVLRLLMFYGGPEIFNGGVRQLMKGLGFTDRAVSKCTKELVANGYLIKNYERHRKPDLIYLSTSKLIDLLVTKTLTKTVSHQPLIDDLISDIGNPKRHPLKNTNRLLLVILLSHADSCGVVRNIGRTELATLTGMSKDQLSSQLSTLKRKKYIRSSVPGVIGRNLFGAVKCVYFLNLKCKAYGVAAGPSITFLCRSHFQHRKLFDEARRLFDLSEGLKSVRENKKKRPFPATLTPTNDIESCLIHHGNFIPVTSDVEATVGFLSELSRPNLQACFQSKLEEYASYILSNHWESVEGMEVGERFGNISVVKDGIDSGLLDRLDTELLDRIDTELLHPRWLPLDIEENENEGFTFVRQKRSLSLLVYAIALDLAKTIYRMLKFVKNIPFEKMDFAILPPGNRRNSPPCIAVECVSRTHLEESSKYITLDLLYNEPKIEKFLSEAEISGDDRVRYGLTVGKALPHSLSSNDVIPE